MTKKKKTLKDIAEAFHGVTSVNILSGKNSADKSEEATAGIPCRVIYHPDVAHETAWRDLSSIKEVKVAARFVEKSRRGRDQKHLLSAGDILIATRGRFAISPIVSLEMVEPGPLIAGPDVIVVRARPEADPVIIRKILLSKRAVRFLRENLGKKGREGVSVLSKSTIMRLEIPADADSLRFSFDERVEDHARDAETSAYRIATLSRAFASAARWRLEQRLETSRAGFDRAVTQRLSWEEKAMNIERAILEQSGAAHSKILAAIPVRDIGKPIDRSWSKSFDEQLKKVSSDRDIWASAGINSCLLQVAEGGALDQDARILSELICGGESAHSIRDKLATDSSCLESVTLLLHRGDHRASSLNVGRSVRRLLASCVRRLDDVIVLSAETGHQAAEVVIDGQRPRRLGLIEEYEPYRSFSSTLCSFISPSVEVYANADVSKALGSRKIDAAIIEASGADADIKDGELDLASRKLFDWANLRNRFKEGGRMIAHVPTSHWKLLADVHPNISMVVQLPPLMTPADSQHRPRNKYAPCDQGLIVVVEPGWDASKTVKVVDATLIFGGEAQSEFTSDQIEVLNQVICSKNLSIKGLRWDDILRDRLFRDHKTWPGASRFFSRRATSQDLANDFTLETIIEELKFCHLAWKASQDAFLDSAGIRFR